MTEGSTFTFRGLAYYALDIGAQLRYYPIPGVHVKRKFIHEQTVRDYKDECTVIFARPVIEEIDEKCHDRYGRPAGKYINPDAVWVSFPSGEERQVSIRDVAPFLNEPLNGCRLAPFYDWNKVQPITE